MAYRIFIWTGCFLLLALTASVTATQADSVTATVYQTVNVRSGPDTRYDIVGQLTAGDMVLVDGLDKPAGRWVRVRLVDGLVGWVPIFVLIIESDVAELPVVGSETPEPGSADGVTVIAYGRVNVRSGPGIGYDIIAQLDVDDTAHVTARNNMSNDWLLIEVDETTGWVAYFTVRVSGDTDSLPVRVPDATGEQLVEPDIFITARFNVRLHTEPTLDSPIPGIVPFGEQVMLLAKSDDGAWLYVAYDDVVGWGGVDLFMVDDDQLAELPIYAPAEATPEVTPEATDAAIATQTS